LQLRFARHHWKHDGYAASLNLLVFVWYSWVHLHVNLVETRVRYTDIVSSGLSGVGYPDRMHIDNDVRPTGVGVWNAMRR